MEEPYRFTPQLALRVAIVGVVAVALFGEVRNGARRWINLGFTTVQPSEIMKIAVPLVLAWYFHRHQEGIELRDYAVAAVLLCVVGFFYLGAFSSFSSIIQLRAPAAVRGRVMSLLMVVLGLLYPVGSIVQGRLADHFGLRVVTAGSGAAMLAVLAVLAVVALRTPAPRGAPGQRVTGADGSA